MNLNTLAITTVLVASTSLVGLGLVQRAEGTDCCSQRGPIDLETVRNAANPEGTGTLRSKGPSATGTMMHVELIAVNFQNVGGPNRQPHAYVYIRDELGMPVDGAKVTGNWSGCMRQNGAWALTNTYYNPDGTVSAAGVADVKGKKTSCWGGGNPCSFVFTVTNVSMVGMTYDPEANVISTQGQSCF